MLVPRRDELPDAVYLYTNDLETIAMVLLAPLFTVDAVEAMWMAGIQGDRRMYGIFVWDDTFESLILHKSSLSDPHSCNSCLFVDDWDGCPIFHG